MKILLTNDDGIHGPGIAALHEAIADPTGALGGPIGELVWTIAPLEVQSAESHGITFRSPLMIRQQTINQHMSGVSVDGSPADCVKVAVSSLWPERFGPGSRPDLVVSGMNTGANVGINVIYSGTVAAALEAAFLGVPSIAVSLHMGPGSRHRFDVAARYARKVIQRVIRNGVGPGKGLQPHECLSLNMPICSDDGPTPPNEYNPPLRVCPMNTHAINDAYERRISPMGEVYYWASGSGLDFKGADKGTDVNLLFERCATLTPLKYDLTEHARLRAWAGAVEG